MALGAGAVAFVIADTYSIPIDPSLSNMLRLMAGVLVAAIAGYQAIAVSEARRWDDRAAAPAWRLIGISSLVFMVGWGAFGALQYGLGRAADPRWVEVIEIASTLFLAGGYGMLLLSWPVGARARLILDSTIATSSVIVLSWYFVIFGVWSNTEGGTLARVLAIAQPAASTVLIFMALVGLVCASGLKRLTASLAVLTLSGIILGLGSLTPHLHPSFPVLRELQLERYLVPLAWLLIAIGGTLNLRFRKIADSPLSGRRRAEHETPLTAAGPYAVALFAFGMVAAQELIAHRYVSAPVFLLCGMLMALIIVRQVLTLYENQALVRQIGEFNRNLEQMVDRRTTQLQSLHAFSKAISTSLDFESVIRAAVCQITEAMRAESIIVNLTPLSLMTHASFGPHVRSHSLEGRDWVYDQLDILDVSSTARCGVLHSPDFTDHRKFAFAPVVSKGRVFGWVTVLREGESYDHEDRVILEGLTLELGAALENTRLYELARQMADLDSVTGLPNHRAAQERFEFLLNQAQQRGESLGVLMIDVDNFKHFNDAYGHVVGDQVLKTIARVLRDLVGPYDVPARYGGDEFIVLVPQATDLSLSKLVNELDSRLTAEGYRDAASGRTIPLAVSVGRACFPDDATSRIDLVDAADRNMYHVKRSAKSGTPVPSTRGLRHETMVEGFDLLDSMITAIDNKDYYTRAHSEEVTEYALWIAQELNFPEEAQRLVRLAGLLHDVGKIGIPDEILRKPGKLTDEEFGVMRQHPEVGAFMVSNMPGLSDIVPGVRHHHEQWDGSGYPEGLKGEEIPVLGRLLAVPDVFSALTTERPYRKGMDWDKALEIILAGSGTSFDPRIVEAFERALRARRQGLAAAA
jgi:diguanylate cyclase (GGDEF)-like protein/putative nucleotidyltransferase with HDIG domain